MVTHPEIQAKAASEIHRAIGPDRLPNLDDAVNLPYIEALIKELHRYHPAVPLLTRSAAASDVYEGLFIPQNAWILTNIWCNVFRKFPNLLS
jgi:cytochrome P450